jgi:hypothetical protein
VNIFGKKLYTTYIRSHLEYASPVWNVYNKSDIITIERVQRRATKVPHSLKQFDYNERLTRMGITQLTERRRRGDCIQQYKIENKLENITWHTTPLTIEPLRGHRKRLRREIVQHFEPRHNFFINRVSNDWNALPDTAVYAESVNTFKNKYDQFKKSPLLFRN